MFPNEQTLNMVKGSFIDKSSYLDKTSISLSSFFFKILILSDCKTQSLLKLFENICSSLEVICSRNSFNVSFEIMFKEYSSSTWYLEEKLNFSISSIDFLYLRHKSEAKLKVLINKSFSPKLKATQKSKIKSSEISSDTIL